MTWFDRLSRTMLKRVIVLPNHVPIELAARPGPAVVALVHAVWMPFR